MVERLLAGREVLCLACGRVAPMPQQNTAPEPTEPKKAAASPAPATSPSAPGPRRAEEESPPTPAACATRTQPRHNAAEAGAATFTKPGEPIEEPPAIIGEYLELLVDGKRYLKFTCRCGKRILFPLFVGPKAGRCSKCGRRHTVPAALRGAGAGKARPAKKEDLEATVVLEPLEDELDQADAGGTVAIPEDRLEVLKDQIHKEVVERQRGGSEAPVVTLVALRCEHCGLVGHVPGAAYCSACGEKLPREAETAGSPAGSPPLPLVPTREGEKVSPGRRAALEAADRWRRQAGLVPPIGSPPAMVSAWPEALPAARLVAFAVDVAGSAVLVAAVVLLSRWCGAGVSTLTWLAAFGAYAAVLGQEVLLELLWGGSLGKRLSLISVRLADGRRPAPGIIVLRAAVKYSPLLVFVPLLLFAAPFRPLHDRIAATRVMKSRR